MKRDEFDLEKGTQIVADIGSAKNRPISISDLNAFFKSSPHLMENDAVEFEQDIENIGITGNQEKWDQS